MNRQAEAFAELLTLMQLEQLEVNLFRGVSRDFGTERVFGGQVLAQALLAASLTVEERLVHSLHAYFLRAGDHHAPIVYSVDRSRDGRSFSARRVVAIQHGRPIFTLAASFQAEEAGLEHQFGIPDVPAPEQLSPSPLLPRDEFDHMPKSMQRSFDRFGPFEFRPVRGADPHDQSPQPPYKELWFKLHGDLEDAPPTQRGCARQQTPSYSASTAMSCASPLESARSPPRFHRLSRSRSPAVQSVAEPSWIARPFTYTISPRSRRRSIR